MNVVMTGDGRFVEVQASAEKNPFTGADFARALSLAESGIRRVFHAQTQAMDGA